MANFRVAALSRNAMLNALRDMIDAGATGGTIKIYGTPQPANADASVGAATLLATLTYSATCAPDASGGTLTFNAITEDASADADGTAVWARVADSDANTIFDCDVSATGAGGTIQLNTTSIVATGPVRITSFTVSIPAA